MNTKILITAALILALVSIPVQPASPMLALPPAPKPVPGANFTLVECVVVMVVIVVAGTIIYGLYKMCKKLDGLNHNTNQVADGHFTSPQGQGNTDHFSIQTSPDPAAPFSEAVAFTLTQSGAVMQAVAYTNGIPFATNSAAIGFTNGTGFVTLDFTGGILPTNRPTCLFFKVAP